MHISCTYICIYDHMRFKKLSWLPNSDYYYIESKLSIFFEMQTSTIIQFTLIFSSNHHYFYHILLCFYLFLSFFIFARLYKDLQLME